METNQALKEIENNALTRQSPSKRSLDNTPIHVQLSNDQLKAGDCLVGSIKVHSAIADQVKKVTLTVRGSSPTAENPKLALFWLEVYTVYVSSRKVKRYTSGEELVIPFEQALPSSASSKRVREAMACRLIVEVEWMQGSFLQFPVNFTVLPKRNLHHVRAPSPYPTAISRSSTLDSSSSLKKRFWPFG